MHWNASILVPKSARGRHKKAKATSRVTLSYFGVSTAFKDVMHVTPYIVFFPNKGSAYTPHFNGKCTCISQKGVGTDARRIPPTIEKLVG